MTLVDSNANMVAECQGKNIRCSTHSEMLQVTLE